jgi:hypothetical protein
MVEMKALLPFALALLPGALFAQETNIFKNSDMNLVSFWKGDRKFIELDGNKIISLEAHPRREQQFSQTADCRGIPAINIRFRYMTKDYKGGGFKFWGTRDDRYSWFWNSDLITDGQWHTKEFRYDKTNQSREIDFMFKLLPGSGTVYFDDITAVPEPKS